MWLHWGCSTGDLCLSAGLCCLLYCVCLCVQMFPGKQSCAILWVHNAAPRQVIYDHVYTESPFHRISHRVTSGSAFTLHLSRDTHLHHFHIHLCVSLPSTGQLFWSTWRPPPLYPVIWKQERKINMSLSDRGECQECWLRRCCCLFTCYCLNAARPPTLTLSPCSLYVTFNNLFRALYS